MSFFGVKLVRSDNFNKPASVNLKFEPFSSSNFGSVVKYDSVKGTCQFPKKFELYIFYFPILENG